MSIGALAALTNELVAGYLVLLSDIGTGGFICLAAIAYMVIIAFFIGLITFLVWMISVSIKEQEEQASIETRWEKMIKEKYPQYTWKGAEKKEVSKKDLLTLEKVANAPPSEYDEPKYGYSILTLYGILEVPDTASTKEIQAAYRKIHKALKNRRKKNMAVARFLISAEHARDVLCDPKKRAEYDRFLKKRKKEGRKEA